jgi:hypothetical protein
LALDARAAQFTVANSKNANPTFEYDCEQGSLPINLYPANVYYADYTYMVGGIIYSEIPQESDWRPTYCNSGSMHFKYAINGVIDGMRIMGGWDAIRISPGATDLTIKNTWISDVRDDLVENDFFYSLTVEDILVDGTFQGISSDSQGDVTQPSSETVVIDGSVIRIREYLYKGMQRFGALFKYEDDVSPPSIIRNTVVAVDSDNGGTWSNFWDPTWALIKECSNNQFLWLSDSPMPSNVGTPPACFEFLKGAEARAAWARAKQNWIDCHPRVVRGAGDPVSDPSRCVANTFGGYSARPSKVPNPPRIDSVE